MNYFKKSNRGDLQILNKETSTHDDSGHTPLSISQIAHVLLTSLKFSLIYSQTPGKLFLSDETETIKSIGLKKKTFELKRLRMVFQGVSFLLICGCLSTSEADLGGGLFSSVDGNVIVMKSAAKNPAISPKSRLSWLDLRRSKDSDLRIIHSLLATGDSLTAERNSRKFLEKHPGHPDGLLALATALAHSRQFDLAAYYANLLEKNKTLRSHALNIKALTILTYADSNLELRSAEKIFRSSFFSDKTQIAAGLNLGYLYLEVGNPGEANKIFQTASIRCAKCASAVLGYGISSQRIGKIRASEKAFRDIIAKDGDNLPALYHLGLLYKNSTKNKQKAEATFKKLVSSNATGHTELRQRANLLLRVVLNERSANPERMLNLNIGGDTRTEDILHGKD